MPTAEALSAAALPAASVFAALDAAEAEAAYNAARTRDIRLGHGERLCDLVAEGQRDVIALIRALLGEDAEMTVR